jgi:6-phosphogluconolactonase
LLLFFKKEDSCFLNQKSFAPVVAAVWTAYRCVATGERFVMVRVLDVAPDAETLAQRAAAWLFEQAQTATGRFTIALSGGSTPRRLYEILAAPPYHDRFPWPRTHLFWGDERFVPVSDKLSNFRMTREALLDHITIPPENIHAVPHEGDAVRSASLYQRELQHHYGSATLGTAGALFDVTLLGLGTDGHTASLFPGTAALDEREDWVIAVPDGTPPPRVSLTFPAIAASRMVAFLAAGPTKVAPLARVLAGDTALPAAHVTALEQVVWFIDTQAQGG